MTNYTFQSLFDFTRTTSGTFVGSDGLIQTTPASVNLLTYTQQFDNAAWTKGNGTATADAATAPDGTHTADKFTENTANAFHAVTRSFTLAGTLTLSCYLKADTRSFAALRTYDGTNGDRYAVFNLATGAAGVTSSGTTSTITSVGNGWYRCSMTYTFTSASGSVGVTIQNADSYVSYTGDGVGSIFLWGAQVEVGSTATTYTRNNGGFYPPRFDYDPVTLAAKGLLIEEQRTNLLTYSEQFDNAAWGKSQVTVTANATTSPDGTVDADKIIINNGVASGSSTYINRDITKAASATTYTVSVFAKADGFNSMRLRCRQTSNFANEAFCIFDLATGTAGTATAGGTFTNASATITLYANGFYRCVLTFTSGTETDLSFRVLPESGTGDGIKGIFLYGAQLEAGAFATSYIPTVASQVTRAADQCAIVAPNFAPWYNQSEGTFVVEADRIGFTGSDMLFAATDSGVINVFQQTAPTATSSRFNIRVGGVDQASLNVTVSASAVHKIASAYKLDDFASVANGGVVVTDASGTLPTVDRLGIGSRLGTVIYNGHIRSIRYFPVRLADFQLQALTA